MPIPKLKKWKSWKGIEVEGPLRGFDTVFIISNSASPEKLVKAQHLYICPEVTSLKNLNKWVKAVHPTFLTISLPINTRPGFVEKAKKFCNAHGIQLNYQVFIKIPNNKTIPDTVRLDTKAFTNINYKQLSIVTPTEYSDDERIE
jgi:hypothetical protein